MDKLRRHALRTARAWALDGQPLFGISVFAVVDRPLEVLLGERFASFRTVHVTTVARLRAAGSSRSRLVCVRTSRLALRGADDDELRELLAVLGPARDNAHYGQSATWREEF